MHIQYATANNYFNALYASNLTFPLMTGGDFEYGWPHVCGPYNNTVTYQTGATTSWQAYKSYVRYAASLARAAESAFVLVNLNAKVAAVDDELKEVGPQLSLVRQFRALVQHHDSVPGTMRTNVSVNTSFWIGVWQYTMVLYNL